MFDSIERAAQRGPGGIADGRDSLDHGQQHAWAQRHGQGTGPLADRFEADGGAGPMPRRKKPVGVSLRRGALAQVAVGTGEAAPRRRIEKVHDLRQHIAG